MFIGKSEYSKELGQYRFLIALTDLAYLISSVNRYEKVPIEVVNDDGIQASLPPS
jgi:hypothetical protein